MDPGTTNVVLGTTNAVVRLVLSLALIMSLTRVTLLIVEKDRGFTLRGKAPGASFELEVPQEKEPAPAPEIGGFNRGDAVGDSGKECGESVRDS